MREAKILLAGMTAERILTGRQVVVGSEHDLQAALGLVEYLCGTEEEASAYLDLILIQTRNLLGVEKNWHAVQQLVGALLEEETIPLAKGSSHHHWRHELEGRIARAPSGGRVGSTWSREGRVTGAVRPVACSSDSRQAILKAVSARVGSHLCP